MRNLLFVFLVLSGFGAQAQILNVESLRKVTDTSGFSGSVGINFSVIRNVNDFIVLGSDIHIQYKMKKHLVLLKNDIRFLKVEEEDLADNGITHLRYNYKFRPKIAWEFFIQRQYNRVALIDLRTLVGTGPRFKLTKSEKYKFYLGPLVMYEYERLLDEAGTRNKDIRGSIYLSFSLFPNDNITIVSTTYYQPLFENFSDYRISSQSSLLVKLYKNLALNVSHTFFFDAFPAEGIPTSQYDLSTGITYTFD